MSRSALLRQWTVSAPLTATIAAGLGVLVLAFGVYVAVRPADDSGQDLPIYEEYATMILDGEIPYRDFTMEYPPGAIPMFVVPAVALGDARDAHWTPPNDDGRRYHRVFDSLIFLLTAAMVSLTALSLAALRRPTRTRALSLAVVASSPLLIGHVFVERYDAWPAALTAAAMAAGVRGRYRLSGLALGLGTASKFYPALLVPVLLIVAARHRGVREAITAALAAVAGTVLVVLPFALASWPGTWAALRVQFGGGLQVETLAGSVFVMARHIARWLEALGLPPPAELAVAPEEHGLGRAVLTGPGVDAATIVMNGLLVVALGVIWISLARSTNRLSEDLVRYGAATVAVLLVLGTVLSAQYVIWLIPLVPLVGGRRGIVAMLCLVVAAALTHLWFPSLGFYARYLQDFDVGATTLLVSRNLALLALALVLVLPAGRVSRPGHSTQARATAAS